MTRLAFLGTPEVAAGCLRALHDAGHDVALVVTAPDRRRGRGSALTATPVKTCALELGLPLSSRVADILDASVELGVVVAFGTLIRAAVLEHVPMVNLHFSLLPRWRGAAPVERAILAGDEKTGVCLMALDEGLDTGPVYACVEVPLLPGQTAAELAGRARASWHGPSPRTVGRWRRDAGNTGTPRGRGCVRGQDRPRRAAAGLAAKRPSSSTGSCGSGAHWTTFRRKRLFVVRARSPGRVRWWRRGRLRHRRARPPGARDVGRRRGDLCPGPPRAAGGQGRGSIDAAF